jgi:Tol biopolymer transport system component
VTTFLALGIPAAAAPQPVTFVASSYGYVKLLRHDGQAVKTLARGESPAWSSDGRRIAFVRNGDVWTIGADGRGLTRVTNTSAIEEQPDWSPDGTLVYSSNRGGALELWTQRPGAPARHLTHVAKRWQEDRSPTWSPDGTWIAFSGIRVNAFNAELYLVRPDGTGLRRVTFTKGSDAVLGDDSMPTWRADGSGLVFVSNRDGNLELYSLDLRSLRTTRLTHTPVGETLPRLSADGRYAFVVPADSSGRLTVANARLEGRTAIQSGTSIDWKP